MTELHWDKSLGELARGSDIEAVSLVDNLASLDNVISDAWIKVYEIACAFGPYGRLTVVVEIWLDTGRIIFVMREKREIARAVLTIPALEREYYSLPLDDIKFDASLQVRLERIRSQLADTLPRTALERIPAECITVVAREADDKGSDRILLQ